MKITFREPCPKHPSIPKEFCACDKSTRGTNLSPIFSLVETEYEGYPIVELLKNAGPIHRHDEHFRFGVRKAEMLLACLDPMKEFAWSPDEVREAFQSRIVQEGPRAISVSVEFHQDFHWSTGELVQQPWLRLQSITGYWPRVKGLGVMKCRAVWILRDQIGDWVANNSGRAGSCGISVHDIEAF